MNQTVIARSPGDAAIWYIGVEIASSLALLAMTDGIGPQRAPLSKA
jgi:hypothetical protein